MLKVVGNDSADPVARKVAAVWFKNWVNRNWGDDDSKENRVLESDAVAIKTHVISLMCGVPEQLQTVLSAAVASIAAMDFPEKWGNLLPELVSRLQTPDVVVVSGVLATADSIFSRFRGVLNTEVLKPTLKICLDGFQAPMQELFYSYAKQLSGLVSTDPPAALPVMTALRLLCSLFYSLNCIDLPEFFQDNMRGWMAMFAELLSFEGPADADDDEPGPAERLQAAVISNLALYAERYSVDDDEDGTPLFKPYLGDFTQKVWGLLAKVSPASRFDELATTSMKFLTSTVSKEYNNDMFPEVALQQMCERIVVPNMMLRESDEELFEDNPVDYIRRDIEGSDSDTRRRAACDLLCGMLKHHLGPVTSFCEVHVNRMLQECAAASNGSMWKSKDAAMTLVLALAVKTQTQRDGATSINERVPINQFYQQAVIPELQSADVNSLPIIKADAIKFVTVFRSQLPVTELQTMFPLLVRLVSSEHYVVHSYAANAIACLLAVKSPTAESRFTKEHLEPLLQETIGGLFSVLSRPNYPENEYIMRAIMKVIAVADSTVVRLTEVILSSLSAVINKVCRNPTNPNFCHFLFEALAALITSVCRANQAAVSSFDSFLLAPFQQILALGVEAISQYVFQVFSLMLELRPHGGGLPEQYVALFPLLLQPATWEQRANAPAVVRLISAYCVADPALVIQRVEAVLGVFQKLLSVRATEHSAFALLQAVIVNVPVTTLSQYMPTLFRLVFARLQSQKTVKFALEITKFLSTLCAVHGPEMAINGIDGLQAGMSGMVLRQVWLQNVNKIASPQDRRVVAIGTTRLLCEAPPSLQQPQLQLELLSSAITLCSGAAEDDGATTAERQLETLRDMEEVGYSAGFCRLAMARAPRVDPFASYGQAGAFLVASLASAVVNRPSLREVVGVLPPAEMSALSAAASAAGVSMPC